MNREALTRTIDLIKKAPPEQCQMSDFALGNPLALVPDDFNRKDPTISCGTAHCAAGWAIAANFKAAMVACRMIQEARGYLQVNVELIALNVLDLDGRQSDQLFTMDVEQGSEADQRIRDIYDKHHLAWRWNILRCFDDLPKELRKQALINVLENLLEAGKVDWPVALERADATYLPITKPAQPA